MNIWSISNPPIKQEQGLTHGATYIYNQQVFELRKASAAYLLNIYELHSSFIKQTNGIKNLAFVFTKHFMSIL